MPASAYLGAWAWCARAEVASKTMSGRSAWASSQSTPSELASRPSRAARRSPSEAGSTPIMKRGSMMSLRRLSLNIRSVPMLPEPTMAAVPFLLLISGLSVGGEGRGPGAPPAEGRGDGVPCGDGDHGAHRAREDDVSRLERHAAGSQGVGEPDQGGDRRPQDGAAGARPDDRPVPDQHRTREPQVHVAEIGR